MNFRKKSKIKKGTYLLPLAGLVLFASCQTAGKVADNLQTPDPATGLTGAQAIGAAINQNAKGTPAQGFGDLATTLITGILGLIGTIGATYAGVKAHGASTEAKKAQKDVDDVFQPPKVVAAA